MDALNRSYQNDFGSVEIARDAGGEQWIQAVDKVHHSPIDLTSNGTALSLTERLKIANYKSAQFKYEVLKKEIENDPELLKNHLQNMVHRGLSSHGYHQKSKRKIKDRRPNLEKVNIFSMFWPDLLFVEEKCLFRKCILPCRENHSE
ncbi:Uncharacterized protein BM_BM18029 [Brugia malayi]|uniref:Uncharacterized protein n=1 Tax=Brugia malayi TaxID=6279 RepID=A8PR74_BRUMA|nr:Uncharacterized protein BM_BM18029 [Brugia malayi]VIO88750.1 Uncharacterized protein BM_BM18029 [Brugia malayi]